MSSSKDAMRQIEYLRTIYKPGAEGAPQRHLIDIVFVHGLNPQSKADFANSTWTHENGNFWPAQQLPQRVPSARILVFSYNSQVAWDTNENGILEHANNLLDRLSGARESTRTDERYDVPIIFVAHSLGGLVVKQALVNAKNDDTYANLRRATYGLVFFAVPHQGGHGAGLGAIAKNIILSLTGDANSDIIESLRSNSLFQENQAGFFKHQLEDYQIVSVYENRPTKLTRFFGKATASVIVDKKSATLGLSGSRERLLTVNSNHSEVCQFEGDDDKLEPVKRAIGKLADEAIAEQQENAAARSRDDIHAQEQVQDFLKSLHFPSIESRQEEIADVHKETFQWIFDRSGDSVRPWSNFVEWLETGRGTYWINGKAGSGKSTLMSYICQDPRTMNALRAWAATNVAKLLTPKFFFWNPGNQLQKSSVGLLRSLLYQIFHEHPEVTPLPEKNEPLSEWTEKRLRKVFDSIAYNLSRSYRVCFFIDGLDEFNGDHDALIAMFQELVRDVNIKVVLSSRPYPIFERAFSFGAMLRLQDLTQGDIKKFVSDKLLALPRIQFLAAQEPQRIAETAISKMIKDIVWKAEGVFLWVDLAVKDQIRGINDEDSLEQLEERLRILPSGLEELYAHMLNNIQKVHRKEAAYFFQFTLFKDSETLLDFTLAAYERLDHDLGSSADFPSEDIISRCESTRRRIITTCVGLLEVHEKALILGDLVLEDSVSEDSVSEDSVSEDSVLKDLVLGDSVLEDSVLGDSVLEDSVLGDSVCLVSGDSVLENSVSEDSIRGDSIPEDSNIRVTFLHRTVADFLAESEQGIDFLSVNTPPNCNAFWVWVKVLAAKIRMFGFNSRVWYTRSICIEGIMAAAVNAEDETGVAQIAVCDYIDIAMKIRYQERDNHSPGRHWCLDIYGWGVSDSSPNDLQLHLEALRDNSFVSTSIEVKEYSFSRPVDFLGFAASCGLKFYVERQIKSLSADDRPSTATYLLCCVISSIVATHSLYVTFHGLFDLICTLLEYSGNPNMQAFGSTMWGQFLALMFRSRHLTDENAWTTILKSFLQRGADTRGILGAESRSCLFDVDDDLLQILSDASLRYRGSSSVRCCYRLRINASVPTLIRYCLGDSPISEELISTCMEKGALIYSKCTEIVIGLKNGSGAMTGNYGSWALSEQQSDRLLDAYERYIVPTAQPSPSAQLELKRQILLLYNELSAREPDHSRFLKWSV